jgi:hypothetical protein
LATLKLTLLNFWRRLTGKGSTDAIASPLTKLQNQLDAHAALATATADAHTAAADAAVAKATAAKAEADKAVTLAERLAALFGHPKDAAKIEKTFDEVQDFAHDTAADIVAAGPVVLGAAAVGAAVATAVDPTIAPQVAGVMAIVNASGQDVIAGAAATTVVAKDNPATN